MSGHAVALLSSIVSAVSVLGQELAGQPPEPLVLEDFESFAEGGRWAGVDPCTDHKQSGDASGQWAVAGSPNVEETFETTDWSAYDSLSFWCHSEALTDDWIHVICYSEDTGTPGPDYYHFSLPIDWEGERHIVIPFRAMDANRHPLGWDHIGGLLFSGNWNAEAPSADTILCLDDITLLRTATAERLVVSDFEADVATWRGAVEDWQDPKVGQVCATWRVSDEVPFIRCTAIPHDWSAYGRLEFWLKSAAPNGAQLKILLYSDHTVTREIDSYVAPLTVDWEGWKRVVLDRHDFVVSRRPVGWNQIDCVTIGGRGWGLTPVPGTVLSFDEMVLTSADMDTVLLGGFEDASEGWSGLERTDELAHAGDWSGRWSDPATTGFIRNTRIPHDWQEYGQLEVWIHSKAANGQDLLVVLYSDNPVTEKVDSFDARIHVDWTGWKQVVLRKDGFFKVRQPVGWQQIENVTIAARDWGLEALPDTVLHFDDVVLRR